MLIVESYTIAVIMCVITMLCWGSWANTQKLASTEWQFQLFYWDYSLGVLLLTLLFAFTIGSSGDEGRAFLPDIGQAGGEAIRSAFIGGVVFNLANILLVVAIDIAGMAVAFPVAIGLALVIGVVTNYLATPVGDATTLFAGVALVTAAILVSAYIYSRLPAGEDRSVGKGLAISVICRYRHGLLLPLRRCFDFHGLRQPRGGPDDPLQCRRDLRPGAAAVERGLARAADVQADLRRGGADRRVFQQGHAAPAPRGCPRRVDLGGGFLVQLYRLRHRGAGNLLRPRPGRHDGGGILGRVYLEGVPRRPRRYPQVHRRHVRAVFALFIASASA
jgi:hypothetical protein